ncbi:RHS repeat-associated core domain-containing protein [Chitinophaga filiformis]|uniref:RHS repeat-associated core domain-containing protein n=1 Tax=Chitinophaga filiformis TaxID=104663 RepID=A0A1G8AFV6_CHIFI|nr:RHS repeat-associated core domain-containing protein [Chitinophaga filiformis]SDH19736.1 RHS repeat-associated core domain-containing protein [Chitinophaga filiformis]
MTDAAGNKLKKTVTDSTLSTPRITETYYDGDFVYNQDTLQLFKHEEGRVRFLYDSAVPRYTYDYFEKDHLGNIRVVLGTSSATKVYTATMETASAVTENALFSNIDATRADLPAGYPADGTTNTNKYVARLNAQNGKKVGPSLVLKVMAGDTIRIGVKAFYKSNGTNVAKSTAEDMLTAMIQSLTGNAEADGMHSLASSGSGAASLLNANDFNSLKRKDPSQNLENKPKAYLNYILFDDQFKMVNENSGVKQVQSNPDEMSTLSVDGTVIKQSGFMYVYTSNESAENVYFDNLIVAQGVGPLLEETHYYPFGLTMSGISSKALDAAIVENKYRFNGIEFENKEFSDGSGLEMYDTDFRQLDPQTGRWWQMDPKPQYNSSPYAAMMNNPVLYTDPMGDTTWVFGTSGQFLGVVNDNLPNQVHFIDNSDPKTAPFDASKLSLEDANKLGQAIRDASVAFMGSKTAGDLKRITAEADARKTELAFVGVVDPDKEIRLSALPPDESNKVAKVDLIGQVDKKYPTAEEQSKIFIIGHVHDREAARPVLYPTTKENLDFLGEPSKSDYQPVLYRSPTATEKGRSVALIATHYGVTIYGTGASRSVYGSEDYVFAQKSHYLLYRNISGKTNPTTSLPHATLTIPKN